MGLVKCRWTRQNTYIYGDMKLAPNYYLSPIQCIGDLSRRWDALVVIHADDESIRVVAMLGLGRGTASMELEPGISVIKMKRMAEAFARLQGLDFEVVR